LNVYLVDTDVISEARKGAKANAGVRAFFRDAAKSRVGLYLSAVTIGELRQGVEAVRYRGDAASAGRLALWLERVSGEYADAVLSFDAEVANVWGRLRVPHPENPLDKQIAATALIYDLTVVTRNTAHYEIPGLQVLNPFV